MWEAVLDALKDFFAWIFSFFTDFLAWALGLILAALPADLDMPISTISGYFAMVNAWVPLDVAFSLITAYYAFYSVLLGVRWLKSFIPGISN